MTNIIEGKIYLENVKTLWIFVWKGAALDKKEWSPLEFEQIIFNLICYKIEEKKINIPVVGRIHVLHFCNNFTQFIFKLLKNRKINNVKLNIYWINKYKIIH